MELIAKSNSMSTAELSQKKAELKLQHKVIHAEKFSLLLHIFSLFHVRRILSYVKMFFLRLLLL